MYGTSTPSSDIDYKGIFLPDGRDIVLGRGKETVSTQRPKGEGEKNYAGEEEFENFSLKQYFKLLTEGQTVCLDMLFAPMNNIINYDGGTNIWFQIQKNRHRFLTKKSGAFVGYCRQQAKKYGIKGSRVAAVRDTLNYLNVLNRSFPKVKLGEFARQLEIFASDREHIEIVEITQASGLVIKHLEVCGRKLSYTASLNNAIQVVQHLMDEYGSRALLAEKNEGVDWKPLSHAVRIGDEAIELFTTKNITFPRPNAEFLIKIKKGELPYKQVAELIEENFWLVEEASARSDLPEEVDHKWIEDFLYDQYLDQIEAEEQIGRYDHDR